MTMLTDAVLVDRVVAGFEGDFDELYRRHSSAAWRLAQAVTGNSHDAADAVAEAFARVFQAVKAGRLTDATAFRAYLLTATRNAAMDTFRRGGKAKPASDDDLAQLPVDGAGPAEAIDQSSDAAMIAEAFRNLPERWRSILWLTEVEGVATKEVAEQLGLSANGAAQLAVRARAGLRERFLQAHLRNSTDPECRFTVDRLGAYVGGGLSPRDIAKVDQHLAGCQSCREKKEELEDLGTSLRRIILPIPLVLAAVAGKRVATALTSSSAPLPAAPSVGSRISSLAKQPTPRMQRLVAASAAGVLGAGMIAATFTGGPRPNLADLSSPAGAEELPTALDLPTASDPSWDRVSAFRYPSKVSPAPAVELARSAPAAAEPPVVSSAPASTPAPPPQAPPAATAPEEESPLPPLPLPEEEPVLDATVGGTFGTDSAAVTVEISSEPEAGVQLGDTVVGSDPEEPAEDGIEISVDPIGADPVEIGLP